MTGGLSKVVLENETCYSDFRTINVRSGDASEIPPSYDPGLMSKNHRLFSEPFGE